MTPLRRRINSFVFYCFEWFFLIASTVCVPVFLFMAVRARAKTRGRFDRGVWPALEKIYYAGHTLAMGAVTFVFFWSSPLTIIASWTLWPVSVLLSRRSNLFYSLYVCAFLAGSLAFVVSLKVSALSWIYSITVLVLALSMPYIVTNLPRPEFKSVVLRGIFVVLISLHFLWFYVGRSGRGIEAVEGQPGVSFAFSFKRDAEAGRKIGEYLRFVKEDCDSEAYYFGGIEFLWFMRRPTYILRYDKATGELFDTGWKAGTSYVADMDCDKNLLYVGHYDRPQVLSFRPGEWNRAHRTYNVRENDIYDVTLLFGGERFLVWDGKKNLAVYDTGSGRMLANHHLNDGVNAAVRADGRECVVCGRSTVSLFTLNEEFPYIKPEKEFSVATGLYSCAYSSTPGRLFGTGLSGKSIKEIDVAREKARELRKPYRIRNLLQALKKKLRGAMKTELDMPRTARNLLLVRPGLVAASDFFGGRVSFLHEDSLELIDFVHTGRRVRNLYLSNDGRKIFFSSALGVGVIDLDEILGGRLRDIGDKTGSEND
ncbi:MAG: hypothetical protein ABIH66_13025 [bacterium]